MTNLEGRVLHRTKAKNAPDGVRAICKFWPRSPTVWAKATNSQAAPRAVWEELRRATEGAPADYSGISYERIDAQNGVFWPCARGEPTTPRMFLERFGHDDGRARFHEIEWWGRAEEPDAEFPLFFTRAARWRIINRERKRGA
jgi:assimilatory nitrate reductase catalytic subunit